MARVKRGPNKNKTRRKILRQTKGYYMGRSNKERQANEARFHAGQYAFQHRKKRKGEFRRLWNVRINAGLYQAGSGLSYSQFMKALKDNNIGLDRKTLSQMAAENPESFQRVVGKVEQS